MADQFAARVKSLQEKRAKFEAEGNAEKVKLVDTKLARVEEQRAAAAGKAETKATKKAVKGTRRAKRA